MLVSAIVVSDTLEPSRCARLSQLRGSTESLFGCSCSRIDDRVARLPEIRPLTCLSLVISTSSVAVYAAPLKPFSLVRQDNTT
jgi:hypothetical protein